MSGIKEVAEAGEQLAWFLLQVKATAGRPAHRFSPRFDAYRYPLHGSLFPGSPFIAL